MTGMAVVSRRRAPSIPWGTLWPELSAAIARLTPMEREALAWAAAGLSRSEISACMGTSPTATSVRLSYVRDALALPDNKPIAEALLGLLMPRLIKAVTK